MEHSGRAGHNDPIVRQVGFFAPSAALPAGQSARDPSASSSSAADTDGLPPLPFLATASPSPPFVPSVPPMPSLPINVPLPSYQRPSPIMEGSECSDSLPPDDSYLSSSATSAAPSGAVFGSVSDVSGPIVSAAAVARAGAAAAQGEGADGAKPSRGGQAGAPARGQAPRGERQAEQWRGQRARGDPPRTAAAARGAVRRVRGVWE
ncbi:hypothetical protein CLOP_g12020 [Closterium sp. NIES-67]|nr:hypothetical protein CLOP_g12020 [Closterium sp. NIES-67]